MTDTKVSKGTVVARIVGALCLVLGMGVLIVAGFLAGQETASPQALFKWMSSILFWIGFFTVLGGILVLQKKG
jgi:hypothetical protein